MGKKLYVVDPEDLFQGRNKTSSSSDFEKAFALAFRIMKMQEKKERKKKEEEEKKKKEAPKTWSAAKWAIILVGTFPIYAPLYLLFVNSVLRSIGAR